MKDRQSKSGGERLSGKKGRISKEEDSRIEKKYKHARNLRGKS